MCFVQFALNRKGTGELSIAHKRKTFAQIGALQFSGVRGGCPSSAQEATLYTNNAQRELSGNM